jgi:monothiol glutaredoxin
MLFTSSLVSIRNTIRILSHNTRTVTPATSIAPGVTTPRPRRPISSLTTATSSTPLLVIPHNNIQTHQLHYNHRFFTTESHSDFAPKRKSLSDDSSATTTTSVASIIESHVKANPVMLYMKGSPSAPQCGFSLKVVQILQKEGVDFASVNVLDYPSIREGIKEYSNWPTIPQLYISGEFIGGCDIVTDLHTSGELKDMLLLSAKKKKEEEEEEEEDKEVKR